MEWREARQLELRDLDEQHLAWSPDGNWLALSDRDFVKEPLGLFLLSIETGERRRLTSPPEQLLGDGWPAFSPDGRTLAFSRIVDFGRSDLYLFNSVGWTQALGRSATNDLPESRRY
jgi:Tol biopolymer transport system component